MDICTQLRKTVETGVFKPISLVPGVIDLLNDEEMEKEVMAQLPGLSVSRWNPFFADVNVAGVNKAMGINEFASYYGFDVSRTIAFGDGGNDISMIRAAGMGIAMGGASEAVKSVADYITEAVDENGVRNALVRFGILE